ncbi:putative phospholipase B-like 2 isoform X1 [Leptidea sinapis]|uniref:putative phospholipase B-like 2 isoform X1 n=2 Tax=Leptidea sinapis TaxID=189913 RepID=UPI00213DCAE1|nr:putative phospholipase B-like 2 isoform X1 [Leptidea sinapis]
MYFRRINFIAVVLLGAAVCECKYAYVKWTDKPVITVIDNYSEIPPVNVARATYTNDINGTGWAYLELHTSPDSCDEKQAYAAGFLEGFLTRDLIWMHWENMLKGYCYGKADVCGLIEQYVDINQNYMKQMIEDNFNDPYWYQLKLFNIQLEGLSAGYNQATAHAYQWLTIRDILWINMLGDLDDLAFALSMPKETPEGLLFGDHCSGLVKLLPDLSELFTSQVTWNSYQSMLRFQKMYMLNYRITPNVDVLIPGRKMSFTSYPAFVQSTDDWYITSAGLVAAETTIGNSNRSLFENVRPDGQILEFMRAMVATRLSRSGEEWVDLFARHNSGTYNNQWYIVDYKKFKARRGYEAGRVEPGLLWVLEQLPGYTEAADLTEHLKATTYFPSYNIAFFPRVFNLSGGNERVATFGDWFGYHTNPRAKMFHLLQPAAVSLRATLLVMRYNDYTRDPLARCAACRPPYSACNAISARNDLNPANGTYPFRALGHRSHGSTDAKVTDSELSRSFRFLGVAGPTHNISRGIPPFQWSKFDLEPQISHEGHPDLWVFPPLIHHWEWG